MPVSITSVQRENGPTCDHVEVTVNDEGTTRTLRTSFAEIDRMIEDLGGTQAAKRTLVLLWAAYRRSRSRAVTGVEIA